MHARRVEQYGLARCLSKICRIRALDPDLGGIGVSKHDPEHGFADYRTNDGSNSGRCTFP